MPKMYDGPKPVRKPKISLAEARRVLLAQKRNDARERDEKRWLERITGER